MSKLSDWERLTEEQRKAVNAVRDRMARHLVAETEAFYKEHPELRLIWSFTCDPIIRTQEEGAK